MKVSVIVLAAGQGKRMNSDIQKQYMLLNDKPVLYYSLKTFEESRIDEVILVVGPDEEKYCKEEIVEKYQFKKVKYIVQGGKERYHSVYAGLRCAVDSDYVFIHDGARPLITQEIINDGYEALKLNNACVVGTPVKDTIKLVSKEGVAIQTPNRDLLWSIQTPQMFSTRLVLDSYNKLIEDEEKILGDGIKITDDAMVVELFSEEKCKVIFGNYCNIKITTPEDLKIAEIFLKAQIPINQGFADNLKKR